MRYFILELSTGYSGGDETRLLVTGDEGITLKMERCIDDFLYDFICGMGHNYCVNCEEDFDYCTCDTPEENVGMWHTEEISEEEFHEKEAHIDLIKLH